MTRVRRGFLYFPLLGLLSLPLCAGTQAAEKKGGREYARVNLVSLSAADEADRTRAAARPRERAESAAQAPSGRPTDPKSASGRQAPLIRLLETRPRDLLLWAALGAAIFIVGWICGGNYYRRRDRINRTKLRF